VPVDTPSKKSNQAPVTTSNDNPKAPTVNSSHSPPKGKAVYTLPANWQAKDSASSGAQYYYNTITGESTWRHPGGKVNLPAVHACPRV